MLKWRLIHMKNRFRYFIYIDMFPRTYKIVDMFPHTTVSLKIANTSILSTRPMLNQLLRWHAINKSMSLLRMAYLRYSQGVVFLREVKVMMDFWCILKWETSAHVAVTLNLNKRWISGNKFEWVWDTLNSINNIW